MDRLSRRDAREPMKKKMGEGGKDKELKRDGGGGGRLPGVNVLGGLSDKEEEEEERVEEEVQGFQTQTSSRSTARRSGSELQRRHPGS